MIYDVAVVGAGPAGLAASLTAARHGAKVLLLEKQWRTGRRLAVTGGGRGNVGNLHLDVNFYNIEARPLLEAAADRLQADALTSFLRSVGVLVFADEEGRLYPYTRQAQTVVRSMEDMLEEWQVTLELETELVDFQRQSHGPFRLSTMRGERLARTLVLAVGGTARPTLGGDATAFKLLQKKGYSLRPPKPALVSLVTEKTLAKADGVRVIAEGTLRDRQGKIVKTSAGEYQITKNGLTGIAAMQLGRYVSGDRGPYELTLDFAPHMSADEVAKWLRHVIALQPTRDGRFVLTSLLPQKLAVLLASGKKSAGTFADVTVPSLVQAVKETTLSVLGTNDWEQAQVMSGGVTSEMLDTTTLESEIDEGLFMCGEMLDVDGETGGYNLHWAFMSGQTAGREAAKKALSRRAD